MIIFNDNMDSDAKELSRDEFGQLISNLEILMIKKYCLRNYLDSYKEVINDFVVNLDPEKSKDAVKRTVGLKMGK